jgi:5-formyltetrahydrofolate cyclo-ligase
VASDGVPAREPARNEPVAAQKAALRQRMLAVRDALPAEHRAGASRAILAATMAHPAFAAARTVMAYMSFGSELDTTDLVDAVRARGQTLVLPRVDRAGDALALFAVRDLARQLVANRWGIREPQPDLCETVEPAALDFVLMPGLAFDARGWRLGYGKAYYDRMLARSMASGGRPFTVAGAFDAQVVPHVPTEPHDVPVARIVTEARILDCAPRHPAPRDRAPQ